MSRYEMRKQVLFGALLAASLVVNIAQLAVGPRSTREPPMAKGQGAPMTGTVAKGSASDLVGASGAESACSEESARLDAQLEHVLRQIDSIRMPRARFDAVEQVNPALARELRQHIDAAHRDLEIECRARTCRVPHDADAGAPILDPEWARDNMRDASSTGTHTYFGIRDPSVASGYQLLKDLEGELKRPGALEGCSDGTGLQVTLRIDLHDSDDVLTPRFRVSPHGAEAESAFGACLLAKVEGLCARTTLPDAYQHSSILVRLP